MRVEVIKKKLIIAAFLLAVCLMHLNCANQRDQRVECEKVAQRTEALLKSNDLEQLYMSLSHGAKSSTPKTEFVERANRVMAELQSVDTTLNFVKVRDGGVNPDGFVDLYYEFRTVGTDTNKVDVEITIDLKDGRLHDVCVIPSNSRTAESERCLTNALRKI